MIDHGIAAGRMPAAQVASLLRVTQSLGTSLDLAVVLQTAIDSAVDVTGLDTGAIYLLEGDQLVIGATTPPLPDDFPDELRRAQLADHPHIAETINGRRLLFIADLATADLAPAERGAAEARGLVSLLYVPLFARDELLGVFLVGSCDRPAELMPDHVEVCSALSSAISLAICNARLYESLRESNAKLARAYTESLADKERLRALATAMTLAEERQRRDIATQLHDRVSQPLAVMKMRLQSFKHSIPGDAGAEDLVLVSKLLGEAIEQTRMITQETSPPFIFELGLVPAVEWLGKQTGESGPRCKVVANHSFDDLDEDLRLFVFQAARELLSNVVKHARAGRVSVALDRDGDAVSLRVADNGVGFEPVDPVDVEPEERGLGLFGLRERTHYLGGTMVVDTVFGVGTTVTITVPTHPAAKLP